MANIKDFIQQLGDTSLTFEEQQQALQMIEQSLLETKIQEEKTIEDTTNAVIDAVQLVESNLNEKFQALASSPKMVGKQGERGLDGKNGKNGLNGNNGQDGKDGKDGLDGKDGEDGAYVTEVEVAFDDTLLITLSNGNTVKTTKEIKGPKGDQGPQGLKGSAGAGVASGGTAGQVLAKAGSNDYDTYWTSTPGIDLGSPDAIGDVTPNSGAFTSLTSQSGSLNSTVIGSTTPAAGTFTTITGQTEVLKGTGQNLFLQSNAFTTTWASQADSATTGQTDPFGGSTAWTLLADGTSNSHGTIQTLSLVSGVTYTQSWYLKKGTNNFAQVRFSATFGGAYANFDLNNGVVGTLGQSSGNTPTSSITAIGNGWYRCTITVLGSITGSAPCGVYIVTSASAVNAELNTLTTSVLAYGAQLEIGSTLNTYIPTTTTAVYGTPSLSFSGVAGLGLQSDGSLYAQPAGTGALQAQATTSTATGGNARGANAVDWQTSRGAANQVASGFASFIGGGFNNRAGAYNGTVVGGSSNAISGNYTFIGGGTSNNASTGDYSAIVGGNTNVASGYFNFVGSGASNSGTSGTAVTTNTTTIALTAQTTIYLSSANASIRVGALLQGTGVSNYTYATSTVTTGTPAVMATSSIAVTTGILTVGTLSSGTIVAGMVLTGTGVPAGTYIVSNIAGSGAGSTWNTNITTAVASTTITGTAYTFTISQAATTAAGVTLSFYTPHGVVVGGGNNQATGSYSFIGGGGDAGTAAKRNLASGDWSFIGGGQQNTASGIGSAILGGGTDGSSGSLPNTATQTGSMVIGTASSSTGGYATAIGRNALADASRSLAVGTFSTTRGIVANMVFSASNAPISATAGVSQSALLVLARQTTDATATVLCSDSSAAGTTNQVILPNNSAYYFKGEVVAGVTGGGNTKGWTIEGVIKRGAGVGTTAIVGTATVVSAFADAGAATWAVTATADTTNGGLKITVTGQAATTIRWVAQIRTTEMTY